MKIKQTFKAIGIFFLFSVLVLPSLFSIVSSTPVFAALNCVGGSTDTPGSKGIAGGKEFCAYGQGVSVKGAKAPPKNFVCPSGSTLIQTTIFVGQQPNFWCATAAVASSPGGSSTAAAPSDAAKKACSGKNGNTYTACVTGFDNPTDTKACDKYTLKDKLTCQTAQKAGAAAAGAAGTGNDNKQMSCDIAFASPLTWILCPVIDIMVTVVNGIDGIITNTLNVDVGSIFCTTSKACDGYHKAWTSFRNIALGLMVLAGLVVVIAQAMGTELLDAYTIRKILPRILIAAIAITLSWSIMKFLVQLTDDLGFGVRQLIYAPFVGLKSNVNADILGGGIGGFFGGLGVVGVAAVGGLAAWIVAGGIGVLISYLATAALAVGIAILVLTIRQVFIIMCVLISPIAIVLYILPNTNRFYKMWWDNFSKALLMFPLIAAMIATGRVFAAVSFQSGGALNGFIAFVSYFAPYFMIPLTFKFAGAAMGSIGGAVHSRGQGARNALTGYRTGQRKSRVNRARTQGLYNPKFGQFGKENAAGEKKSIGKLLNKAGDWTVDADERIPLGLGRRGVPGFKRGAAAAQSKIEKQKIDHALKAAQEADMDWKTGLAAGGMLSKFADKLDPEARKRLDTEFGVGEKDENGHNTAWRKPQTFGEFNQMADMLQTGDESSREAAEGLRAKAGYLSDLSVSDETRRADSGFVGLATAAKEGRLENADIIANHNAVLATSGRETAQRQTTMLQQLVAPKRPSLARGHAIEFSAADEKVTDANGNEKIIPAGTALDVYRTPDSPKAQASVARETSQDVAGAKSEELDGLSGQAWVAGISKKKMEFNPTTGKMQFQRNADGTEKVVTKAQIAAEDPTNEDAAKEAARAAEMQSKLRTLAQYSYGDSDTGLKIKKLWTQAGLELSDLGIGSRLDPEEAARHASNPPPKPEGQ